MAAFSNGRVSSPTPLLVDTPGSFLPAGVLAPTGVTGKGFTVARTGVGLYRVSLLGRYPSLVGFSWGLALAVNASRTIVLKSITLGLLVPNTIDLQVLDAAGAAAEIAADPANIVSFEFLFTNTVNPSL